jgi:hypothetical protein
MVIWVPHVDSLSECENRELLFCWRDCREWYLQIDLLILLYCDCVWHCTPNAYDQLSRAEPAPLSTEQSSGSLARELVTEQIENDQIEIQRRASAASRRKTSGSRGPPGSPRYRIERRFASYVKFRKGESDPSFDSKPRSQRLTSCSWRVGRSNLK